MQDAAIAPPFPAFPLTYENDLWVCPITKVAVPKRPEANVLWRRSIEAIPSHHATMAAACAKSPLLWINLCGWTYRQHAVQADGSTKMVDAVEVPMITWPAQDYAINTTMKCIKRGKDVLFDKSRDQGATWLALYVIGWHMMFRPGFTAKMISRKETEVDTSEFIAGVKGNPDTLFWRLRFLLDRQPKYLSRSLESGYMSETNQAMEAICRGESTNKHVSRGGRMQFQLLDECSVYDDLGAIDRSTHRAAACRLFNATPVGPTYYSQLRFSGKCEIVVLGWWNHPEQGRGRHVIVENGKPVWHGPFREHELANTNRRAVAQNLDIDHEQAGALFFDMAVLARQRADWANEPATTGAIVASVTGDDLDEAIRMRAGNRTNDMPWRFQEMAGGPLRLWCRVVRLPDGSLGPPPDTVYVMGIDIAQGVGASNSSIAVFSRNTGVQVAEWTSSTVNPMRLARVAATLGLWFRGGGSKCAFMAWEHNGWGLTFAPELLALNYPWIFRRVEHTKLTDQQTDQIGWWNNDRTNKESLGRLANALETGKIAIRSPEALTEASKYVFTDTGTVEPAGLAEEGGKARATHGDRWRAIAVAWEAMQRVETAPMPAELLIPGTVAWQLAKEEQERREARSGGFQESGDSEDY